MTLCWLANGGCGDSAASPSGKPADGGDASTTANLGQEQEVGTQDAGGKVTIGNWVFDDTQMRSYYLTFSDAEYAKLMDVSTLLNSPFEVNTDRYVEASLRVDEVDVGRIAVRFKGNYSIWGCVDLATKTRLDRRDPFFGNADLCQRFSFKLDLDKYVGTTRLDGLKKLNLHAMAADPTKMRERLGYSLFRDMRILAPRAAHAKVYINGTYHGLFVAIEQLDGRFTAQRFPQDGDGNLYKNLWPASSASKGGAEAALETNNDSGQADVFDFLRFRDAVVGSTSETFATQMAPYLDLDYLARYIVVDRAIANFDGIMAFYEGINFNYYWYHDKGSNRFFLIPWDFDKVFWYPEPNFWSDNSAKGNNIVPNWNVITTGCKRYRCNFDALGMTYTVRAIDCDPFLKMLRDAVYGAQQAIVNEFIAGVFSTESVGAKIASWKAQIGDAFAKSPGADRFEWEAALGTLLDSIPKLQNNVQLMMSGLVKE